MAAFAKSTALCLYFGLVTLIVTEALVMLALSFVVSSDKGWVVVAAIVMLPVWALFITAVFMSPRRWRLSFVLWGIALVAAACLYFL